MKNLILYGIGNARYQYRALRYFYVYDENADVAEIKRIARMMQVVNPSSVNFRNPSNGTRLRAAQFSKIFWREKALRSSNL